MCRSGPLKGRFWWIFERINFQQKIPGGKIDRLYSIFCCAPVWLPIDFDQIYLHTLFAFFQSFLTILSNDDASLSSMFSTTVLALSFLNAAHMGLSDGRPVNIVRGHFPLSILAASLLIQDWTIGTTLSHSVLGHSSSDRNALVALISSLHTTYTVPLTQAQYGIESLWSMKSFRRL